MVENERPDPKNHIYCKTHDIFFNKRLREEADKENERLKKAGLFERVDACPICKQEFALALIQIHSPKYHDRVLRERTLFQGTEDLSKI